MNFNDYQGKAGLTAVYPPERGLEYLSLGLVNEAGEVAGKVKKFFRGDYDEKSLKELLVGELGDVLWYLAVLSAQVGLDFGAIAQANIDKLYDRKERGVLKGNGDTR